jgi:hypothetical protein
MLLRIRPAPTDTIISSDDPSRNPSAHRGSSPVATELATCLRTTCRVSALDSFPTSILIACTTTPRGNKKSLAAIGPFPRRGANKKSSRPFSSSTRERSEPEAPADYPHHVCEGESMLSMFFCVHARDKRCSPRTFSLLSSCSVDPPVDDAHAWLCYAVSDGCTLSRAPPHPRIWLARATNHA